MENSVKVPAYLKVSKILAYAMYIWVLFGIIVLGLRVFLLATSANETTPFVHFIINTSNSYLQPFRGIFPPKPVGETGYLDVASLFAMIIYGLIGWGFSSLIDYIQSKIDSFKAAVKEQAKLQRDAQARAYAATQRQSAASTTRKPGRTV